VRGGLGNRGSSFCRLKLTPPAKNVKELVIKLVVKMLTGKGVHNINKKQMEARAKGKKKEGQMRVQRAAVLCTDRGGSTWFTGAEGLLKAAENRLRKVEKRNQVASVTYWNERCWMDLYSQHEVVPKDREEDVYQR